MCSASASRRCRFPRRVPRSWPPWPVHARASLRHRSARRSEAQRDPACALRERRLAERSLMACRSSGSAPMDTHRSPVYGPDLMLACTSRQSRRAHPLFLRWSTRRGHPVLRDQLTARFPSWLVAAYTPVVRPLERRVRPPSTTLRRRCPDVFLGRLSTPKQERFMAAHWRELTPQ